MKWIFGVYKNYESIKRGTGLLFKEKGAARGSANVIISEDLSEETTLSGRGADFKEITHDTENKADAGETPDVITPLDTEALGWLDHFMTSKKPITFRDAGPIYI